MAVIRDIYELTTKSDVSELQAVAAVIGRNAASIRAMAAAAGQATAQFLRLRPTISGTLLAARNLGAVGFGAFRGLIAGAGRLGMVIRGLLPGIGILAGLLGGLAFGAVRAIGSMRDRMAESETAARGAGGATKKMADDADTAKTAMDDVGASSARAGKSATGAGKAIRETANVAKAAAAQVQVAMGAFGDVGAGFVQRQGALTSKIGAEAGAAVNAAAGAADAAAGAEAAADAATDAYEAAGGAGDAATQSTNRFVNAVDRIGAAWGRAGDTVMLAIAEALTPALEDLATLMESPEFQEFVRLLADDLGGVITDVSNWLQTDGIPAVRDFLAEVNKAGGPINFVKQKFNELKTTALQIIAILLFKLAEFGIGIRTKIQDGINAGRAAFAGFKFFVSQKILEISTNIGTTLSGAWDGISGAAQTAFDGAASAVEVVLGQIKKAFAGAFNTLVAPVNAAIGVINALRAVTGLPPLALLQTISLARGGIVTAPTLALIGDNPSRREAVIPLDSPEAAGLLGGGGLVIQNLTVALAPGGYPSARAAGSATAEAIYNELRARGKRVP